MSHFTDHCSRCTEILGNPFPEVHLWLDFYFDDPRYGTRHRHMRHNQEGIEEVRRAWGDKAARAAEIHIRQDIELEGWPADRPIPADSKAYRRSGLW